MEIAAALSSLKAIVGIAQGAIDARDDAKAKDAVRDISQKLLDLYAAAWEREELLTSLKATVESLGTQVKDLEAQLKESASYKLTPLGKNGHAYLLVGDDGVQTTDAPVYFCQHCRDKGIKSILRRTQGMEWEGAHWYCVESNQHAIYE